MSAVLNERGVGRIRHGETLGRALAPRNLRISENCNRAGCRVGLAGDTTYFKEKTRLCTGEQGAGLFSSWPGAVRPPRQTEYAYAANSFRTLLLGHCLIWPIHTGAANCWRK
jgi:hypothetical protein